MAIQAEDKKTNDLIKTYRAYYRVSTDQQDAANQAKGVREYAASKGMNIDEEIADSISSKHHWRDRGIGSMIYNSTDGDIILVSEISRLARSALEVLDIMQVAVSKSLTIHIVKSGIVVDGSMQSKIMCTIFGLAAEIERDFIRSRTAESLSRRKQAGLPMGRPAGEAKVLKLDSIASDIEKWHAKKIGWASVAKLAGVSRSTLYAWAKRRHPEWLKKNEDVAKL